MCNRDQGENKPLSPLMSHLLQILTQGPYGYLLPHT